MPRLWVQWVRGRVKLDRTGKRPELRVPVVLADPATALVDPVPALADPATALVVPVALGDPVPPLLPRASPQTRKGGLPGRGRRPSA